MGFIKIHNLYQAPEFFECYCQEKVHGTSSHLQWNWKTKTISFFSGGVNHQQFVGLFNQEELLAKFSATHYLASTVIVYGEAFGGKCQGMSKVYGKDLRFIAFDVKVDDTWLDVPSAEEVVKELGLQFVPYNKGPMTVEWLNSQRDLPSLVAVVPDAIREGVVIRPLYEMTKNNGERFIAKHKREEFRETNTPRELDLDQLKVLSDANMIATEWSTENRLQHVLQKCSYNSIEDTGNVIRAMIEDIKLESSGEVVWSKAVEKAIGRITVKILHRNKFSTVP